MPYGPTPLQPEGFVMADGCTQPADSNAEVATFLDTVLEPEPHGAGATKALGSGRVPAWPTRGVQSIHWTSMLMPLQQHSA